MLGKRQLALVEAAHAWLDEHVAYGVFGDLLKEAGATADPAKLTTAGFNGFMDRCTVQGFRDRRRPILSAETMDSLDRMLMGFLSSRLECDTLLRRIGRVGDLRDLDGDGLLNLLITLQPHGAPVQAFIDARRRVSRKQLALLHVARSKVKLLEKRMSWTLQTLGGVNTPADLDARGFDLAMAVMRHEGFEWQDSIDRAGLRIGYRPGFATPEQIKLIMGLWKEWHETADEAALGAWLERFFNISALRFLTSPHASKAITALKAMKRRAAERPKVSA